MNTSSNDDNGRKNSDDCKPQVLYAQSSGPSHGPIFMMAATGGLVGGLLGALIAFLLHHCGCG